MTKRNINDTLFKSEGCYFADNLIELYVGYIKLLKEEKKVSSMISGLSAIDLILISYNICLIIL